MIQSIPRRVDPEALDSLEINDPAAQRSRHDLRRLHSVMRTLPIFLEAFTATGLKGRPLRILELGAGDGTFALRMAEAQGMRGTPVSLTLLDRQAAVARDTLAGLESLGWATTVATVDVFDWFSSPSASRWDVVMANLFMHHFQGNELSRLMNSISLCTSAFFCCEPKRGRLALVGSHLVGFIGAGPITRKDAVLSVHAGFRSNELSALWPRGQAWNLREYSAGLFSHCLMARKER